MPPKANALIRDLPPVVDLRPVPKEAPPAPEVRWRVVESPPGADGRPRAPRREVELAVPGYPGFTVWVWANYPQSIRQRMIAGGIGEEEARPLLARLVVAHNGWCDEEGAPYPDATDPAFWDTIPDELGRLLVLLVVRDAPAAFPKSVTPSDGS